MSPLPRQKLTELISRYGTGLCHDVRRCKALLSDLCGSHKCEIHVLIQAQKERVPEEMLSSRGAVPPGLLVARLTKRLKDHCALSEPAARWAVESWAVALLLVAEKDLVLEPEPSRMTNAERPPHPQLESESSPTAIAVSHDASGAPVRGKSQASSRQRRGLRSIAVVGGVLLTAGAAMLLFDDSPSEGGAAPFELLEQRLPAYVPVGYELIGGPVLQAKAAEGSEHLYNVSLKPVQQAHRVPIVDLQLPTSYPPPLRKLSPYMQVHPRLPPGKALDADVTQPLADAEGLVEGTWRVRLESGSGGWHFADADSVRVLPGDDNLLLSGAELSTFAEQQARRLAEYRSRWGRVEEDVTAFEAQLLETVPVGCERLEELVDTVFRLTTACAQAGGTQGEACEERNRKNEELGACKRQSQVHERAEAEAAAEAARYRDQRWQAFREELEREARNSHAD